jgi:hypothetical protein
MRQIVLFCLITIAAVFCLSPTTSGQNPALATAPTNIPTPMPTPAEDPLIAAQKVKLFYLREATQIVTVLNALATPPESKLKGLAITNVTEDEIILYGPKTQREHAYRVISTLDLPRPGINMEMWGIQISSKRPESMTRVMPAVRDEINRTQQAVQDTYVQMQRIARETVPDSELDVQFEKVLVVDLGYTSALDAARPLSLGDILLRLIAARDPVRAAEDFASRLDGWLKSSKYADYAVALSQRRVREAKLPFERFLTGRGLRYTSGRWTDDGEVRGGAEQGKIALLDFAFNYGQLVHQPQSFSAYHLQQSAEALNSKLQAAIDAVNFDLQDLFVAPTLIRIGDVVHGYKDVEYAQVGKVSVATLSGVATVVTSHSVNAFDVTPPLRLSELLSKASTLSQSVTPFDPAKNTVGALPLSQVIGLIGAFGEERSVWRELQSGVSITFTPNVLRNMTSAELKVDLKTGDPQAGTRETGVKPLSRVSQHDVNTSIYVNALDFFDLSAFASQSTLGGGRGYVPVIGPIWQGLFGEIPIAGHLFSWKRSPKTVYTESLVLTTSFITPTAMGIALLYPTQLTSESGAPMDATDEVFTKQKEAVRNYKLSLRH